MSPTNSERLIGISDAFSAFVYGYPSSCPRAQCTPNKSVTTLRYTRRPGHGCVYIYILTECSPLDFRRSSIDLLCVSWTHCVVSLFSYQLTCRVGHEHSVLCVCLLINWQADRSWTHCRSYCVCHGRTVLRVCVLINWPAAWVINTLRCICVLIKWFAV